LYICYTKSVVATYKLIQDIEAEDHILGPLTLRQFIFGLIGAFMWYLSFIIFVKHIYFLLILFVAAALFCTFFAVPFGRDQPTEVWALAKLRFWFKPRRRLWDQSGVKELVTITVPKKIERVLTNGLSQNEVESRLKALASTLDTRGWAVKNAALGGGYTQPNPLAATDSDRLIDISSMPNAVPSYDVQASDDILDETSNPLARQFNTMINQSSQQHRQQLMQELNDIRDGQQPAQQTSAPAADYWFMKQAPANDMPQQVAMPGPAPATPIAGAPAAAAADDAALGAQLKARSSSQQVSYSHLRTLQPLGTQPPVAPQPAPSTPSGTPNPAPAVTAAPDPAILSLANNDDLNVSTLAREAHKAKHGEEPPQGEVVISLR
jgi:hypothetical protein